GAEYISYYYDRLENLEIDNADEVVRVAEELRKEEHISERTQYWILEHRYLILGTTWLSTVAISLSRMRREHYLFPAQKLIRARVIAQAMIMAMLLAAAVLEARQAHTASGKYEIVKVYDMNDPAHMDMLQNITPSSY
ncbi:hypothetical protein CC78DRAFT_480324, partial [Lojkania enalia]